MGRYVWENVDGAPRLYRIFDRKRSMVRPIGTMYDEADAERICNILNCIEELRKPVPLADQYHSRQAAELVDKVLEEAA